MALPTCRSELLGGVDYGMAVGAVLGFSALAGLWLRALGGRLAPGAPRLLAVLPVVVANLLAPRLFCRGLDATTLMLVAFNQAWLSSFKALAWAFNRGPLADPRLTSLQFVAVYAAPLTPKHDNNGKGKKGRLGEDAGGAASMLGNWVAKLLMIGVILTLLAKWADMPGLVRSFLLTWGLYGLLSSIMDGPGVLITGLLGIELSPHFDRPWLSNSFASFWNKRWDLAAGNTLRTLIYDPIVEGRLVHNPQVAPALNNPWRLMLGTTASFTTSGLLHEGIYWYMTGGSTGGVWLSYFFVQAPLIIVERVVLGLLKKHGIMVPNLVRIVGTIGLCTLVGHWLFWPPMEGPPSEQILGNIKDSMQSTLGAARGLLADANAA